MGHRNWSAVAVAVLFLFTTAAEARTWKNQAGKEIEGEMLSADATSVTLRLATGDKVTFKIALLCKEDQEFIAETQRVKSAFGEDADAPSTTKPEPKKAAPTVESRVWTDKDGRKVNARFISVKAGIVTLRMGTSKTLTVPLANFSESDKQYVNDVLEARGETLDVGPANAIASNTPSIPANPALNSGLPGGNGNVPSALRPTPNRPTVRNNSGFLESKSLDNYIGVELEDGTTITKSQIDAIPAEHHAHLLTFSHFPEDSRRNIFSGVLKRIESEKTAKEQQELARVEREQRDAEFKLRQQENEEKRRLAMEEAARNRPVVSAPTYTPPATPGYTPPPTPSYTPPPSPSIPVSARPSMQPEADGYCSSCKKPVPSHIGTGGKCPHCGITFDYDETKGETASSSWSWGSGSSSGGSSRVRIPVRGIIGLGVLVLGILGWLGRKLTGED